jgi:hypothetical protein
MSFSPSVDSPYSNIKIPYVGRPFVLSVIDYFGTMSLATHASFESRDLNYDNLY